MGEVRCRDVEQGPASVIGVISGGTTTTSVFLQPLPRQQQQQQSREEDLRGQQQDRA